MMSWPAAPSLRFQAGDALADFLDRRAGDAEHAVDRLRKKFGADTVVRGIVFDSE